MGWFHTDTKQIDAKKGTVTLNYSGYALSKVEWLDEAESPTEQEWVSVEKRLPELNQNVLVIIGRKGGGFFDSFTTYYKGNGRFRDEEDDNRESPICDYSDKITHWQPLPSPPHQ